MTKYHDHGLNLTTKQMQKLAKGGNVRLSPENMMGNHHVKLTKKQLNKISKAKANKKGADISLTNEQLMGSGFLDFLKPVGRVLKPVANIAFDVAKPIAENALREGLTNVLSGKGKKKGGFMFSSPVYGARSALSSFSDMAKHITPENIELVKKLASNVRGKGAPKKKKGGFFGPLLASALAPVAVNAFRKVTGLGKKGKKPMKVEHYEDFSDVEGEGIVDDVKMLAKRGAKKLKEVGKRAYEEIAEPYVKQAIEDVKRDPISAINKARRIAGLGRRKGGSFLPAGGSFKPVGY